MASATEILHSKMRFIIQDMAAHQQEAIDLKKLYFSEVDSDTVFSALLSALAATFSTKLTKGECVNGATFVGEVVDFFTNSAVTQGDYHATIQSVKYGNHEYTSPGISPACEAYGERLKAFAEVALDLFLRCLEALDIYTDNEIADALGALSGDQVPWVEVSVADFTAGITLIEQYKKMINNEAVSTADYGATVAKWERL